ncbi:MAG: TonB-dependent receptor [Flavobacteriales bacterium]|nr:TonB-dependent receptor [Flavobacteriales bacterium]
MKNFKKIKYLTFSLIILISTQIVCQENISGTVFDQNTKERLIGANIIIKDLNIGTTTNFNGDFTISINNYPANIECSYIGYQTKTYEVKDQNQKIEILLTKDELVLSDIEIVDTRLSEKLKQSPITIEAMDVIAIKEAPSSSFYESLGNLKGVDMTSASLGFKIINTRGFNSTSPVRSLQIIDGVDNQSPGLNFSLGNFLGTTELDTKGVEIIVGANSALYGANAFNGVISMTTKDPFMFPGTSYQVKMGERSLIEHCFRYATHWTSDKDIEIGFKFNIQKMSANDWEANNLDAVYDTELEINNYGGYDAVNRYGDEWFSGSEIDFQPNLNLKNTLRRTGYMESDLADYNTENLKFNTAFHFRKNTNELIYSFNFGSGTTIYQGDNRYSLKNIRFWQNKLEYKRKDNFFIRFYTTHEDAGDSYDIVATAQALSDKSASNIDWVIAYKSKFRNLLSDMPGYVKEQDWNIYYDSFDEWQIEMINLLASNEDLIANYHQLAREYTDQLLGEWQYPYLQPGTQVFDSIINDITSKTRYNAYGEEIGGTKFYDKSSLYNLQIEKKIDLNKFGHLKIGANGRLYTPDSQGSIFNDGFNYIDYPQLDNQGDTIFMEQPTGNFVFNEFGQFVPEVDLVMQEWIDTVKTNIQNYEYGMYIGYENELFSETLLVNATARVDKNENFNFLFSPATSIVYKPNERDIIRVSLSSAIRNPTLTDQYLNYNAGLATLLGNINGFGFNENFVTSEAIFDCVAATTTTLGNPASYFLTNGRLQIDPIKPEQVETIELGFRTTLFNKIYIDASGYYSRYNNFIGYQIGASYETDGTTSFANQEDIDGGWASYIGEEIDYKAIIPQSIRFYRIAANAKEEVTTQGISLGINYYMNSKTSINGNYSWNKLNNEETKDPLIPAYNTPEHKFNIGISSKFKLKKASNNYYNFSLNYKWIEGFLFEGSPQFTGPVETYGLVDGQINRVFNQKNGELIAKIGVSNLLNNQIYQAYGAPKIGRLSYISLSFHY